MLNWIGFIKGAPMKHTIREMTEADLENVAGLFEKAYTYLAEQEGFTPEQRENLIRDRGSVEALEQQMREYRFYVLVKEGLLKGVMALKGHEITKLFIDPSEIGSGLGSLLFEAAQRTIARAGHDVVVVGTTGHAIGFYLGRGMEITGTRTAEVGPLRGWEITVLKKQLHTLDTTRILRHDPEVHL